MSYFNSSDVAKAAREDLDFLAALCMPEIYQHCYPPTLKAFWQLLIDSLDSPKSLEQLALGIPRGFTKTALLKLFCVYCILFTDKKFIALVCNTSTLAENFMKDVFDILSSPNIVSVFGDWRLQADKDTQVLKNFTFRGRRICFVALGSGSSVRGLNINNERPDIILMDDMQSRDEASNDKIAEDLLIWMFGTLIKARDYKKCLVVFLGNMYPYDGSILKKLKYNPMWKSLICGAILADGESIWPEFRSVESLLEELENDTAIGHREIFYAEIMNDENASGSSGVNLNKIPSYPVEFDSIQPTGGFIVIDPASGKKQGDDVAIGVNFIVEGKPVFKYLKTGTFTPSETIKEALSLALQYSIPLICVEAVAYQSTLLHWFGVVCESLGISGIFLEELSPKNTAKNTRIKNGLIAVVKGEIILHPEVKSHVIHQAVNWDPHKVNNKDDILDLVAYIPQVMEKYLELTRFLHKPNLYELEVEASFTEDLQLAF